MKSLVVGMGIGGLYQKVLQDLGAEVVTVDINGEAKYRTVEEAFRVHGTFDTAHICVPNYLHEKIARQVVYHTKILFVEKPGFASRERWEVFVKQYPNTRVMMVKNNMWRGDQKIIDLLTRADEVRLIWNNKHRIPKPGSWFTNKYYAYGGVEVDLLPHLLSYIAQVENVFLLHSDVSLLEQTQKLETLDHTDYGEIFRDGTFNVPDTIRMVVSSTVKKYKVESSWMCGTDFIGIKGCVDGKEVTLPLGLCPEEAYARMIEDAVLSINNPSFWTYQTAVDLWIHGVIHGMQNTSH